MNTRTVLALAFLPLSALLVVTASAASVTYNNTFDNGGASGYEDGSYIRPGVNLNPDLIIGSNAGDSTTWGTGNSSGASGPDLGSTWRGALVVRCSYVLDAGPADKLETLSDLANNVTRVIITLNVTGVGSGNSANYRPLVYYRGIITAPNPSSGYWGAWDAVTRNATAANVQAGTFNDNDSSTTVTIGDSFTFTFPGSISGAVNTSDFIGFGVIGNEDAAPNESLTFGTGTLQAVTPAGSVISVNLAIADNDNNKIEADETAGIVPADGANWNHVQVSSSGATQPTTIYGNVYDLNDDHGNANAATLTSTLQTPDGYCNWSNITPDPPRPDTGNAALMHNVLFYDLALDGGRHLEISGLGHPFTTYGYDVYLYCEGNTTRKFELRVTPDGGTAQSVWGADTSDNSDVDNDGIMEWEQATGTSFATANSANFARFRDLTAAGFAIDLASDVGRAALNGFQIVAHDPPPTMAPAICVNLCTGDSDDRNVTSDEVAGVIPMNGEHWNNVQGLYGPEGQPVTFINQSFDLKDSEGNLSAATLVSTLDSNDGYTRTTLGSGVVNPHSTGDRGMMHSYVGYDINNTDGRFEITGIGGEFLANGYDVYIMFERNSWLKIRYTVTPSGGAPMIVTGWDGASGNQFVFDGVWVEATGTDFSDANFSNYCKFERVNAESFTIDIEGSVTQTVCVPISGIQIVARQTLGTLFIVK